MGRHGVHQVMTHLDTLKQMVHELEYVLDCINKNKMPFDGDDFHEALRLGRQAITTEESSVAQKPLTEEQIVAINDKHYNIAYRDFDTDIAIARSIEAAHGIKEEV